MSRVGKVPVKIESGVDVNVTSDGKIVIKAGKSQQEIQLKDVIKAEVKDGDVVITRVNDEPQTRAYHGLYRALVQNAMTGVSKGWEKGLELNGVGYRANVSGKNLELSLGFSHPITFPIPSGIDISVEKQTRLSIKGANKELVGQVAAKIRSFRPPEPYLGNGVKYSDEVIKRKAGKSGGK
jgi:large subunit ribosomal protein L6